MNINPEIDLSSAATTLASRRRVQIHDFASAESAKALHDLLQQHDDWYLSYNEGPDNFETSEVEFAALTMEQKHRFTAGVYRRASRLSVPVQAVLHQSGCGLGRESGPSHARRARVGYGEGFSGLMRDVTGRDDIRTSDSYASLYGPGHFLTRHDDRHPTHQRIAAWVLSMTPEWDENWGATSRSMMRQACRRGLQTRFQYSEFVHGAPAPCSAAGHTIRRRTANQLSGVATGLTHQIKWRSAPRF